MGKQRTTTGGADGTAADASAAEDAHVFRNAVRDVKPLSHPAPPAGLAKTPSRARRRKPPAVHENLDDAMPLVYPGQIIAGAAEAGVVEGGAAAISGGDTLSFQRAGVQTQVLRRLRRGLFPIEAELDLHGLTQTAARDQLARFLTQNRDAGYRCVRIIHGKGYRSGARGPILKIAVDLWLRRHLDVMAFTSARAIDGGTGALYVLLRA
jgi:DNA-nicking Smr family endonuclease